MLPEAGPTRTEVQAVKKALQMCLNWKVLAGLGGVAVIVWLVAPKAVLGVLPFLAFLACPISMLLVMRAMQADRADSRSGRPGASRSGDSPEQGLAELKGRLADVRAEQESIAQQIDRLESGGGSVDGGDSPAALAQVSENDRDEDV